MKSVQVFDEGVGVALDIGAARPEQLGLNRVESAIGVRPSIDLRIEFRNKAGREDFGTLPTGARREPAFFGAGEIVRGGPVAQFARTSQRLADSFDHVRPVALGCLIERRGIECVRIKAKRQQDETSRHSHVNHRLRPLAPQHQLSQGTLSGEQYCRLCMLFCDGDVTSEIFFAR